MGLIAVVGLLVLIAVLAGGAYAVALARRGQDRAAASAELLPGVDTGAPASWGLSHDPEARLHRRLGDALRSLRAQADLEGVTELELRVELEQQAIAVDRRLVAAAALPPAQRGPALAEVEVSVAAVEQAAADLARGIGASGASAQVRDLEDLTARIRGLTAEPALDPALDPAPDPVPDPAPEVGEGQAGTA
jgi:hypothetical protein